MDVTTQRIESLITLGFVVIVIVFGIGLAWAIRHADRRSVRADVLAEKLETIRLSAEHYRARAERAETDLADIRHPRVRRADPVDEHFASTPREAPTTRLRAINGNGDEPRWRY